MDCFYANVTLLMIYLQRELPNHIQLMCIKFFLECWNLDKLFCLELILRGELDFMKLVNVQFMILEVKQFFRFSLNFIFRLSSNVMFNFNPIYWMKSFIII